MKSEKEKPPEDYGSLLIEVKERVRSAQYEALREANKELAALYWDIGMLISRRQDDEGWGKSVVKRPANDLQMEFPGIKGFSVQNLWYMRQFFLEYHESPKLQPMVGEIAWSHNLIIMSRCKDPLEREFYIRMTRKFGKMQLYLTALARQVREEGENPSIGIILCKEKKRTIVEYTLHDARKPIGVATYQMVRKLPKELKGQLPSPEEIAKLLEAE